VAVSASIGFTKPEAQSLPRFSHKTTRATFVSPPCALKSLSSAAFPSEKRKMSYTNNTDSLNTIDSYNTTLNVHLLDESTANIHLLGESIRTEILAWLSPLEPRIRHKEVQSRRVPGVGDWLLCTEIFQSWSDVSCQDESSNATLFCYGDPGVGKTYIT